MSSLATALPVATAALAWAESASAQLDQPTPDATLLTPSQPAPAGSPRLAARPSVPAQPAAPPIPRPTLVTPTVATASAPAAGADIGRSDNTITLASANTSPARPAAVPATTQDTGGSGGLNAPTQPSAPASASLAPVAATSSPSAPALPADLSAKIRPMTLAASTANATTASPQNVQQPVGSSSGSDGGSASGTGSNSGSSSNSNNPQPPPTIFISGGSGKDQHDTSPNPPPTAVQGSEWAASLALQGPTAASWQVQSYTWTFPSGAVKGYGTFQTNTDDSDGPYTVFAGNPTSAKNTTVSVQGFTADDLTNNQGGGFNDPDYTNFFYWGPAAVGPQTVSVSATIRNTVTGALTTVKSSAVTNVVQPKGSITATLGTAGLSTGPTMNGDYFIGIDKGTTYVKGSSGFYSTGPTGIDGNVSVDQSSLPSGVTGTYALVQTISINFSRSYDGSYSAGTYYEECTLSDGSKPAPVLDSTLPYNGSRSTTSTTPLNYVDSPASSLNEFPWFTTPFSLSRRDSFTDTLMFNPGGIWVPVGSTTWNWSASADYNAATGKWTQDSASQGSTGYVQASGNGDFPVWSHNFTEYDTWTSTA